MAAEKGRGLLMVYVDVSQELEEEFNRNLYRLIYPRDVSAETAQAGMAPALLVGRMSVPPGLDADFNQAYNQERMPLYRSIPGYIRGRRFTALMGEPQYITVHECQSPAVADSPDKIQPQMTHTTGSPGVYIRIFP